ncbi:MAG: CYTH domain-containing protein [Bacteroidetes bacterium]|nr:MAG: CYTH domain-containing protein [Bacteroidota bacterium]
MVEIERKFLVNREKWNAIEKPAPQRIVQGYLSKSDQLVSRVRLKGEKAYLTIKGSNTGITRAEFEYEIPVQEAEELLRLFCPKKIVKNRYKVKFGLHIWEVDDFTEPFPALLLAEIELKSEDEDFECPEWVEKEVSEDPKYFNSNMI